MVPRVLGQLYNSLRRRRIAFYSLVALNAGQIPVKSRSTAVKYRSNAGQIHLNPIKYRSNPIKYRSNPFKTPVKFNQNSVKLTQI